MSPPAFVPAAPVCPANCGSALSANLRGLLKSSSRAACVGLSLRWEPRVGRAEEGAVKPLAVPSVPLIRGEGRSSGGAAGAPCSVPQTFVLSDSCPVKVALAECRTETTLAFAHHLSKTSVSGGRSSGALPHFPVREGQVNTAYPT